jgi:ribonuclease Z
MSECRSVATTVVITGTGSPVPSPDRAGPGVLVRVGELAMQFDAGRSTVQRLAGAGLWPTDLDAVFLTHHHSDHVVGLADLVLTRWIMDRTDDVPKLPVIAPAGPTARFAAGVLVGWEDDIAVRRSHSGRTSFPAIDVRPFPVPSEPTEVWSGGGVRVLASAVRHEPVNGAVGYRIETPDGVVAISGDTTVCDEVVALAQDADVLVHEAMRFEPIEALPAHRRFILDYHADTRLLGALAMHANVDTLMLTHLLPVPETAADKDAFAGDLRAGGFSGDLIVADDLDAVTIDASRRPETRAP